MNPISELRQLLQGQDDMLMFKDDFFLNYHLKAGKQENVHYKVVDKQVWDKLHAVYGGL